MIDNLPGAFALESFCIYTTMVFNELCAILQPNERLTIIVPQFVPKALVAQFIAHADSFLAAFYAIE